MLTTKEPALMWAWVCPITGMVWTDGWGATETYATQKTERTFGKRRMEQGDMRLVRVTIEPCSDEEAEKQRAELKAWKERKMAAAASKVKP